VKINDKIAKPGAEVKVGDIITIRYGSHITRLEVLDIADNVSKADSAGTYKILQEEQAKDLN
jgi:ribosomal 50S subunit-recycling heat shock protein